MDISQLYTCGLGKTRVCIYNIKLDACHDIMIQKLKQQNITVVFEVLNDFVWRRHRKVSIIRPVLVNEDVIPTVKNLFNGQPSLHHPPGQPNLLQSSSLD